MGSGYFGQLYFGQYFVLATFYNKFVVDSVTGTDVISILNLTPPVLNVKVMIADVKNLKPKVKDVVLLE